MRNRRLLEAVAVLAAAGCAGTAPDPAPLGPSGAAEAEAPASFTLTMMDVGTGLAVLVRGEDFALLYDAGSNDDRKTGAQNRALAYLEILLGPSGPKACRTTGTEDEAVDLPERPIAHVVLSHPHRDHLSLLPDVFRCFAVGAVWESGTRGDTDGYRAFDAAASAEAGAERRTAAPGDGFALGRLARARVLSARAGAADPNDASIVLRLDLGRASVLLMGDAPGGERRPPGAPPDPGSVEADLLARDRAALDADVLVVGHHGSMTSSRAALLDAVRPRVALLSSGPFKYGGVELPDPEVVGELLRRGIAVHSTKVDEDACREAPEKVGADADGAPGGCSAVTVTLRSDGRTEVAPGPLND